MLAPLELSIGNFNPQLWGIYHAAATGRRKLREAFLFCLSN
jgi:hypothetical protein